MKFPTLVLVSCAIAFLAAGGHVFLPKPAVGPLPNALNPACRIKGNISSASGERIYHMPGQYWYDKSWVLPQHGERWFCNEAEARAAGWRKASY
jgi:hypothetical protein